MSNGLAAHFQSRITTLLFAALGYGKRGVFEFGVTRSAGRAWG